MKEGGRGRKREEKDSRSSIVLRARSKGEGVDIEEENGRIIFRIYARASRGAVIRAVKLVSSSVRHRTGFLLRVVTPLARRLDPRHHPPPFATGTTKNSRSSATNSVDRNTIGSGSFRPNV